MWLVGNLLVWLECIGLVSGCCKEVYIPTPLVLALFLQQQHPYFSVHIFMGRRLY